VVTSDKDSVTIKGPRNESIRLPGEISNYDVVIPESIEKIAENLVEMEVFNEGVILHQVRQRYLSGMIYTFVGSILIALNPYQRLNIYGDELMHSISRDVKANRSPSPHVFSIGGIALHNMINDNLDQSVLISGESGAGKTETTKKVLTYFSSMAGSTASRAGITVESQILDSNPLLEGFGNAKTVRNNNSSIFGKYMEVNFDSRYFLPLSLRSLSIVRLAIKGCNIVSYLLEKTRVVMQMPTERNYHSFYMLLAGASKEM
jgi:myosin heavy subunit